jgi:hypothetical protein
MPYLAFLIPIIWWVNFLAKLTSYGFLDSFTVSLVPLTPLEGTYRVTLCFTYYQVFSKSSPVAEAWIRNDDISSGMSAVKVAVKKEIIGGIDKNSVMAVRQRIDPISGSVIGPV